MSKANDVITPVKNPHGMVISLWAQTCLDKGLSFRNNSILGGENDVLDSVGLCGSKLSDRVLDLLGADRNSGPTVCLYFGGRHFVKIKREV